jgi:hypothetical protein
MNTLVWIVQGLLTLAFLLAGSMKLAQPRAKVIASGGKWAEDFAQSTIKIIGAAEVLLAFGVSVPMYFGFGPPTLTSFCAAGIAVIMVGAFVTHLRRKEHPFLFVTGFIFLLAIFVAYERMPAM